MELITGWLISYGIQTAGGAIGAFILGWILKKIPTDKFAAWAKKWGEKQGAAVSGFFNSKLPKLWNGVIEPIVIDTINALGIGWLTGFVSGLKSDNP